MTTLRPIAVVDTETTSLANPWLPEGRRPWEIAIVTPDNDGPIEFSWRLALADDELANADPEALSIARWRERQDEPGWLAIVDRGFVADQIIRLLDGKTLVGVNPDFDAQTLAWLVQPLGPTWHYHTIDVTTLGAHATGLPLDSRSEDVSKALGVDRADFQPAHSAIADARWALGQYEAIERLGGAS